MLDVMLRFNIPDRQTPLPYPGQDFLQLLEMAGVIFDGIRVDFTRTYRFISNLKRLCSEPCSFLPKAALNTVGPNPAGKEACQKSHSYLITGAA